MADEVRQKFEAWADEYARQDKPATAPPKWIAWDAWRAAYEAGEIAMKEKAAQLCEREVRPELDNFNDLNRGWNEALSYAAGAIRAGGQEAGGSGDGK